MAFTYKDYVESDAVKKAQEALNSHNTNKPGEYQSQYGSLAEEAAKAYANRNKFSYDLNGDALYQQYKDKYIQQGKMAMQDTMGQAAALTGGYGNSYAASVGNQAYQAHLQNLNDIIPELYQLAYDRYNQEGQDMLNRYNLYANMDATDYSRYRDTVSDWTSQRDYLANMYNNERTYDRNIYDNDRNFAYSDYRNAIADEQWQKNFDESVRQYNATLAEQQRQYNETMNYNKTYNNSSKNNLSIDDYHEIMYQVESLMGDNDAVDKYLQQLVSVGIITEEEKQRIYETYRVEPNANTDTLDTNNSNTDSAKKSSYLTRAQEALYNAIHKNIRSGR